MRDTLQTTMAQYHFRARPMKIDMLDNISLDKAFEFYKDRFSDFSDFTFYIVGNIDMKQMKEMVETYVATLPSKNRTEKWKDLGITVPKGLITKSVYKGVEPKSSVSINITGPFEWNAKNRFNLQAMTEVLSIKLRETLREEKGGVYGVGARATPTHYPHEQYQLTISFGCAPERVDELVTETLKKLDTMVMKEPEETYVNKVKEIQKHEYEVNMKENRFWLSSLSSYYFNGEDPKAILERKEMIEHLNADDIHHAAQKYCAKGNMVEVVLYPAKKN
jgi:zinc protease